MKKLILSLIILFTTFISKADVDHSIWNTLLKKYVSPTTGFVNYKGMIAEKSKLDQYLQILSKTDPAKLSKKEQLVFWMNAYNAFTVDFIVQNYPVKSIKDIREASGAAKALGERQIWVTNVRYPINGKNYSLYSIENGILRKDLFDPRIHFAINCASFSCPKLQNQAFTLSNVEQLLNAGAKSFVNDITKNKITKTSVQLSKIFDWYKGDFTKSTSLIAYINQYATTKIDENAKISYIEYDWKLNEQP